ncbi:hypothetical protein BN997_01828 [Oceanobacillus oncorhynchi]|uniref:Uncharacterized protein n=1 Tax=Oceanobacillus oncorhynchi TaxID=545501 RepID=A0A0A1MFV2_9BACI|nr:hypothetical protein BN997_01828 [Oceanobacillus oncorhynchi]
MLLEKIKIVLHAAMMGGFGFLFFIDVLHPI